MLAKFVLDLEVGLAHLHKRLGIRRPSDDAAVVVAQHDHGLGAQVEAKHPLAARVEAVAVDEGEDSLRLCHGFARCRSRHPIPGALRLREGLETDSAGFPI